MAYEMSQEFPAIFLDITQGYDSSEDVCNKIHQVSHSASQNYMYTGCGVICHQPTFIFIYCQPILPH